MHELTTQPDRIAELSFVSSTSSGRDMWAFPSSGDPREDRESGRKASAKTVALCRGPAGPCLFFHILDAWCRTPDYGTTVYAVLGFCEELEEIIAISPEPISLTGSNPHRPRAADYLTALDDYTACVTRGRMFGQAWAAAVRRHSPRDGLESLVREFREQIAAPTALGDFEAFRVGFAAAVMEAACSTRADGTHRLRCASEAFA